ncbi:amino acid permease [Kineococcus sp. LSe6-4]|uniref:Amino acid permease n=1 Tax=Kineococcus halophytocola TaxID=3234027 RepID=A0ABV4H2M1_9ACTN
MTRQDVASKEPGTPDLQRVLTRGQMSMMALGSAIGAGLFVGSGQSIATAGPAVLVSYAVAGLLAVLVMGMLAEMAAAEPASGAFSVFTERALGQIPGATIGWLYWVQLIVVVAAEATGAASITTALVPGVPQWVWVLVFVAGVSVLNLLDVRGFGRFEFWLAIVKVAAIVAFLVVGVLILCGVFPSVPSPGLRHLVSAGGFAPAGIGGISAAILVVVFAFGGIEIVAIAAAESDDPAQNVRRAVTSVLWRILVFYIGSIALIVAVLPWNDPAVAAGPFAAVLNLVGLPGADTVLSIVIVLALLSALNATLYGASRMIFSLGERGYAPRSVNRIGANGTPRVAVLASVSFGFVTVLLNFAFPGSVLPALLNVVGSTLLVTWGAIAVSQIVLRRRADRAGTPSPARLPGFPVVSILALVLIAGIVALTMGDAGARVQLLETLALTLVLVIVLRLFVPRRAPRPDDSTGAAETTTLAGESPRS